MSKFILRLLLLMGIYLVCAQLMKRATPFYLGNVMLAQKMPLFNEVGVQYNTAFFGNSLVNRQLNPITFDKHTTRNTKTFNLASDATPFEECAFIVENFLDIKEFANIENVLIILNHSGKLQERNLHTYRTANYHDLSRLKFGLNYRSDSKDSKLNHIYAFLENNLGMFRISRWLEIFQIKSTRPAQGVTHAGFEATSQSGLLPIDASNISAQNVNNLLEGRTTRITDRISLMKRPLNHKEMVLYQAAIDLKTKVEKNGRNLHYVFLPNSVLYYKLNIPGSIYLGDGPDFQEYFTPEYWFNAGHLNDIGSEVLTKKLAEKFNTL